MRILEISDHEGAAAYCGKLFRRWGHEVVRVESPDRAAPDEAAELYLNGGKRRVACDLNAPDDLDRLRALSGDFDILVTDRSVADIERYGLTDLGGASGPRVRLALTPFGLTGPYAHAPATEASLLALGGYSQLIGDPDGAPLMDPAGAPLGVGRVVKGGSHLCHDSYCHRYRVAAKTSSPPDSSAGNQGFRLAR